MHSFWFIEDLSPRTGCEVFGNHKQCSADGWVEQVVVDKLSYENSSGLVSLKSISPLLKVKLQELINVFCLIICFWVEGSRKLDINVHVKIYLFSEIIDELGATIWYNRVGSTVFSIEFSKPGVAYTDSINLPHRHEHSIFWEAVHDNHHIGADLPVGVDGWR